MDIATLIGFVGTFGLILMAMGDPSPFVDMPSVYIVLGVLLLRACQMFNSRNDRCYRYWVKNTFR